MVQLCAALQYIEFVFDKYIDEITQLATKDEFDNFRKICGTNDVYSVWGNSFLTEGSPYKYYLMDSQGYGHVIKATSKKGKRTYYESLDWDICVYEFHSKQEISKFGKLIISWAIDDLSEVQKQNLLTDLQWRGLYTNSKHQEYALYDILGTVGSFIPDNNIRAKIWIMLDKKDMGSWWRETCLRSIVSQFETYPEEIRTEVISNVKKCMDSYFDGDSRLYLEEIRLWLRNQGIDAPSQIPPVEPPVGPAHPDDIFRDAAYDYYRRYNPKDDSGGNTQTE